MDLCTGAERRGENEAKFIDNSNLIPLLASELRKFSFFLSL